MKTRKENTLILSGKRIPNMNSILIFNTVDSLLSTLFAEYGISAHDIILDQDEHVDADVDGVWADSENNRTVLANYIEYAEECAAERQ